MKVYATRAEMVRDISRHALGFEIGVQRGDFAAEIVDSCRKLHLVDAWAPIGGDYSKDPADIDQGGHDANLRHVEQRFRQHIEAKRVEIWRGLSEDVVDWVPANLADWVYLDANHTYRGAMADLCLWERTVRQGGALMGHDYVDNEKSREMGFGVVQAVKDFCATHDWQLVAVTFEEWPSFKLMRK